MLIMSRREGETIRIGDDIEILIAHVGRTRVKVGIRAPRSMPVIAYEVKLVRDQNLAAAAVQPSPADLSRLAARFGSPESNPRARILHKPPEAQ
ncbi:MAG TPA: carbon storage regulator [Bryobacteraceae bacterium]|nr:carbon storage regulator [Bryobacteraceae bacterium]